MITIKVTGKNHKIIFSQEGHFILLVGTDGSVKLLDRHSLKIVYRAKMQGKGRDLPIYNFALSPNNQWIGFSCNGKVYLVFLKTLESIEINVSSAERMRTHPFAFDPSSTYVYIPDGITLKKINLQTEEEEHIALPKGAGFTNHISVGEEYIAYSSCNYPLNETLQLIRVAAPHKESIPLPYNYVPGCQMYRHQGYLLDSKKELLINHVSSGIQFWDLNSLSLKRTVSHQDLGLVALDESIFDVHAPRKRNFHHQKNAQFSPDGQWVIFDALITKGLELCIMNLETLELVYQKAFPVNTLCYSFYPQERLVAYVQGYPPNELVLESY